MDFCTFFVYFVGISTGVTVSALACNDVLDNCHEYSSDQCRRPNLAWAKKNCALRCGLCPGDTIDTSPTVIDTSMMCNPEVDMDCDQHFVINPNPDPNSNTGRRNSCSDRRDDCHLYGSDRCRPPNIAWARKHCARRCGLCHLKLKKVSGCYINGVTLPYGRKWVEQGRYTCECLRTGGIECNFFPVVTLPRPRPHSYAHCYNYHTNCHSWAMTGECDINPQFMHIKCPKSCGRCH